MYDERGFLFARLHGCFSFVEFQDIFMIAPSDEQSKVLAVTVTVAI
jgi:hypothetical protein